VRGELAEGTGATLLGGGGKGGHRHAALLAHGQGVPLWAGLHRAKAGLRMLRHGKAHHTTPHRN